MAGIVIKPNRGVYSLRPVMGRVGPQCPKGQKGDKGDTGDRGPAGPAGDGEGGGGVIGGGTAGQVLAKATSDDYDVEWINPPSGGTGAWDDITGKPTTFPTNRDAISDATTTGRDLLAAANAAGARNVIGAASTTQVDAKLDKTTTKSSAGSAVISRVALTYTPDPANPDLSDVTVGGVTRSWINEWGAYRARAGVYSNYADAAYRAIIESGDFVGSGSNNNAIEIVDRRKPSGVGRQIYGRRWNDGALIRHGVPMTDCHVKTASAPMPTLLSGVPALIFNLPG